MLPSTRRTFLKVSAAAGVHAVVKSPASFALPPSNEVRGWVTTAAGQHRPMGRAPQWRQGGATAQAATITLHPETTYQDLLGFGAAFTDASCWLFSQMTAKARRSLLEELYGRAGLGLSIGRCTIGASDYSRDAYNYDDTPEPDPELTHFSTAHDNAYILPTLREAREINPELFLFSSPWTPPGWMKASRSLFGGNMRDRYFASYARFFVRYLQDYARAGVPIAAVTVQNEVDTDQDGRMPQCEWGEEYERKFVEYHLGPALEKAGLKTQIWVLDHNYNLQGRVLDQLADPEFSRYVSGIAWHGYVGTPDAMTHVHDLYPSKAAYWTEGGPNTRGAGQFTNWCYWSAKFTGILRNWSRAIVSWNLLLDEKGQPNIGPFACAGLVTQNSGSKALTRSGQYHAFAHFAPHLQRGARVFASSGVIAVTPPPVDPTAEPGMEDSSEAAGRSMVGHLAAANPDGSRVVILTNPGVAAKDVQLAQAGETLLLTLPPDSVTTLRW